MFNLDEHPAQFRFDRLKIDQVLPVSIFVWSVGIGLDRSNSLNALKTATARANTTTAAAAVVAVAIEQQTYLLSLLILLNFSQFSSPLSSSSYHRRFIFFSLEYVDPCVLFLTLK